VTIASRAPREVVLESLRTRQPAEVAAEVVATGDRVVALSADRKVEVFRVQDGRIVEQWNAVLQPSMGEPAP
jgi:hypothetical protein